MQKDLRTRQIGMIAGLGRIYRYALPYWMLILLTFVSMMVFAGSLTGRAYIAKPFLELLAGTDADAKRTLDYKSVLQFFTGRGRAVQPQPHEAHEHPSPNTDRLRASKFLLLLPLALAIAIAISISGFVKEYTSAYVVNRMTVDLQCDLCTKFLELPMSFHTKLKKGEVYARLGSDVSRASLSFHLIFGDLLQEPLTLLVGIVAMFVLNWQLTLLLSLALPPLVFLTIKFGTKIRKKSTRRQEMMSVLVGSMIQMFSGIKVVKAFQMEHHEGQRFRSINMELFRRIMKVEKTGATSRSIMDLFNHAIAILLIAAGVIAISNSMLGLTLPDLATFLLLAITLYKPIKNLSQAYNKLSDSMAGIQRVYEILNLTPPPQDMDGTRELSEIREGIDFDHVFFSYDGQRTVLQDINLHIPKEETIALVGRTGVGKTTMSDLLLRFYTPTQGEIRIDGVDIREFTRESLLRHIAVVTQDPFLFDTSVEENIRYGKPHAPDWEVIEAAKAAHIHDVILALPQGYKTRVGDRGTRLSGGERQRITIARAILKNPSILILDEATASLDSESETLVQRAIENLMRGRTTVVIAHRLSTIKNAHKIVVLEDGKVSMTGTHEELIQKGGLYKELCEMQFLHDETSTGGDGPENTAFSSSRP